MVNHIKIQTIEEKDKIFNYLNIGSYPDDSTENQKEP
jgi:hypothetical protein